MTPESREVLQLLMPTATGQLWNPFSWILAFQLLYCHGDHINQPLCSLVCLYSIQLSSRTSYIRAWYSYWNLSQHPTPILPYSLRDESCTCDRVGAPFDLFRISSTLSHRTATRPKPNHSLSSTFSQAQPQAPQILSISDTEFQITICQYYEVQTMVYKDSSIMRSRSPTSELKSFCYCSSISLPSSSSTPTSALVEMIVYSTRRDLIHKDKHREIA